VPEAGALLPPDLQTGQSRARSARLEIPAHHDVCAGCPFDLPEERRRVIDLTHFAPRKSAPATPYLRGKSELRSRKNANCRAGIFGCAEPSSAGIEVVGGQFVANLGRTRLHIVQAVIAHAETSSVIPAPN
jgi:hypothetical protein